MIKEKDTIFIKDAKDFLVEVKGIDLDDFIVDREPTYRLGRQNHMLNQDDLEFEEGTLGQSQGDKVNENKMLVLELISSYKVILDDIYHIGINEYDSQMSFLEFVNSLLSYSFLMSNLERTIKKETLPDYRKRKKFINKGIGKKRKKDRAWVEFIKLRRDKSKRLSDRSWRRWYGEGYMRTKEKRSWKKEL